MNTNIKQNQEFGDTKTTLTQNLFNKLIGITVKVCITGVTIALASVPAEALLVHSVEHHQFKQESNQYEGLSSMNRNLNRSSESRNSPIKNIVDLKSTQTQEMLEPITRNTQIYSSCLLYSQLPNCNDENVDNSNPEYLKSTLEEKPIVPIEKKIAKKDNCWLKPHLPGCQGGGW